MQEPWDEDLARLFEETRQAPPAADFARRVATRIRGARLRQAVWRIGLRLLIIACAAVASPYVARGSIVLIEHMERWIPSLGGDLLSPTGWACSIVLAIWILSRAKVLRRSRG